MKKYIRYALVFLALGIVCGVFYREFTKAYDVVNVYSTLGVVHVHFLALGTMFTLVIGLVTEKLNRGVGKLFAVSFRLYATGMLGTGIMLLVRGILDVLVKSTLSDLTLSSGATAAISGVAGIFHAVLGVGLVLIFVCWLKKDDKSNVMSATTTTVDGDGANE